MTPHHLPAEGRAPESSRPSPSKSGSRDEIRGAYRAQSIRVIQEADGDVAAFLEEVDTKRRQLDEQIHRYVKQKEREFKLFERDARIKYRSAGAARPPSPRASSVSSSSSIASMVASPSPTGKTPPDWNISDDGIGSVARPRPSRDRETDFLGVFTPSFLPLLNNVNKKDAERAAAANIAPSTSAPPACQLPNPPRPGDQELHRANSDPSNEPPGKQVRLKLEKRHSSSGSEGRGLISALKSSAPQSRLPKQKRVSLIVGDEVVAPSDNIAAHESANELARDLAAGMADGEPPEDATEPISSPEETVTSLRMSPSPDRNLDGGIPSGHPVERHKSGISFALANNKRDSDGPKSPIKIENVPTKAAGEDLFGFDDIADEDEGDLHIDNISDEGEAPDISPIPSPAPAEDIPRRSSINIKELTLNERPASQIRTLSSSSAQPISPGFSKPSVNTDPVLIYNKDLASPEIEDNMDYGSVTHSFLDRTGSLGESFMERNAQEMRKLGRRRLSTAKEG